MLQQRPGALARLGVRPAESHLSDLHHPNFTVDESRIPIGLCVAELATSRARSANSL